jgi:hypothetical protein
VRGLERHTHAVQIQMAGMVELLRRMTVVHPQFSQNDLRIDRLKVD